jgi:hypothetical protein
MRSTFTAGIVLTSLSSYLLLALVGAGPLPSPMEHREGSTSSKRQKASKTSFSRSRSDTGSNSGSLEIPSHRLPPAYASQRSFDSAASSSIPRPGAYIAQDSIGQLERQPLPGQGYALYQPDITTSHRTVDLLHPNEPHICPGKVPNPRIVPVEENFSQEDPELAEFLGLLDSEKVRDVNEYIRSLPKDARKRFYNISSSTP